MTLVSSEDLARRVAVFHTITREVDKRALGVDPEDMSFVDEVERWQALNASLVDMQSADDPDERDEALLRHAALAVGWLEDRARNQATEETP